MAEKELHEMPIVMYEGEDFEHYWVIVDDQDIQEVKKAANFGQHMRTRRLALGYSQQGLAGMMKDIFGFPWYQTVVAKVEAGDRIIKADEALALAHLFAMNLEELLIGFDLEGDTHLIDNAKIGRAHV